MALEDIWQRLKHCVFNPSEGDKTLQREDIRKLQRAVFDHTVEICSRLERKTQSDHLLFVENLSVLPAEKQRFFDGKLRQSVEEGAQLSMQDKEQFRIILSNRLELVSLLNCMNPPKNNIDEYDWTDKCSKLVGRQLTPNELREASITAKNQFHHFVNTWGRD
jgi:hypothetical protein